MRFLLMYLKNRAIWQENSDESVLKCDLFNSHVRISEVHWLQSIKLSLIRRQRFYDLEFNMVELHEHSLEEIAIHVDIITV